MAIVFDLNRRFAKLNLNRASYGELIRLPGIGDILARRIIEFRKIRGKFHHVEDLVNFIGMQERRLSQILHRLEV